MAFPHAAPLAKGTDLDQSLSALLPVRNVESTLATVVSETLEVLSELTDRFELIVVDDCSHDATIEVADELAACYPQLRVVRHSRPLGRSAAMRTALECSKGDVIFAQDVECRLGLDSLRKLWHALDECDIAVAYSPPTPEDGPNAAGGNDGCRAGFRMGTRPVFERLGDSIASMESVLQHLSLRGGTCTTFMIPDRVPSAGAHRIAQLARRLFGVPSRPDSPLTGTRWSDPPEPVLSRPKKPNYLTKARELVLGE